MHWNNKSISFNFLHKEHKINVFPECIDVNFRFMSEKILTSWNKITFNFLTKVG